MTWSFWDGTRWVHADDLDPGTGLPSGAGERRNPAAGLSRAGGWGGNVVMLLVLVALAVPVIGTSAGTPTPALTTSPDSGGPGSRVVVNGSDFPIGSMLQLTWDGSVKGMPKAIVATRGSFQTRLTVPSSAKSGEHALAAVAVTAALKGKIRFTTTLGAPIASVAF